MTFVNPEISCIRKGSGPALFGLARVYCIYILHWCKKWEMINHEKGYQKFKVHKINGCCMKQLSAALQLFPHSRRYQKLVF